jgi:hypothetical protein
MSACAPVCLGGAVQAEIEHFVHPDDKSHAKFGAIADLQPLLYSRELQMGEPPSGGGGWMGGRGVGCGLGAA